MSHRRPHLSLVESSADDPRGRFKTLTGRDPTPAELKAFERWKVIVGWGLPLAARKSAARVINRL